MSITRSEALLSVLVCAAGAAVLAPPLGLLADDATPPPSGPCDFPPDGPEPDGDCFDAISDLLNHGSPDWTTGEGTFKIAEVVDECILTINETDYVVVSASTATPATCGLSGQGHTLDLIKSPTGWKVMWSGDPDDEWQASVRVDDVGWAVTGSGTQ